MSINLAQAKTLMGEINRHNLTRDERIAKAIKLAALIQNEANLEETKKEKAFLLDLSNIVQDVNSKMLVTEIADQAFRSSSSFRAANQIRFTLKKRGIPSFLSSFRKWGVELFQSMGVALAPIFIPLIKQIVRQKTGRVIISGEKKTLEKHLKRRREEGVRLNLNHLGEAILGEKEAADRLAVYINDLENPDIEYVSVKISTLYSQIQLLDWKSTLQILSERYKRLLLISKENIYQHFKGALVTKFVNLDMEEYKDLQLTVALFKKVLSDPECLEISAGIVLQSYLPDSFDQLVDLTEFAKARVKRGGAPIKIRLVKGANLAMEKVESSIRGWPLATYESKADVDANFKKMMEYAIQKENAAAVLVGVGSHNLFDIAYAHILASERGVTDSVGMEMLEGMGEPIRRIVQKITGNLLLYCPMALKTEFQNAIAYLIRRLDENTGPENFLRVAFNLEVDSPAWIQQAKMFSDAAKNVDRVKTTPNRTKRRSKTLKFENDPDTDWSLLENIKWGQGLIEKWKNLEVSPIPLVIGAKEILRNPQGKGVDPARPDFHSYSFQLANEKEIDICLSSAQNMTLSIDERAQLLEKIADKLHQGRERLMGAALRDVGKTLYESDPEVSEAIDFARYYSRSLKELTALSGVSFKPKGIVVIASPWNFPSSIPAGGILAALAAGNAVIFKPAPEAVLVGYELVKLFYEAGVSQEWLQFAPCTDAVATQLMKDPRTSTFVLTGATKTAQQLLHLRPGLDLVAETGGKNSLIVTALADRDLAIRDIVQSAFSYAGQKCSACSLVILEAEVFDDPHFKNQLKDATESLFVGSPYNSATKINPLIRPPGGPLAEAMLYGTWLVHPHIDPHNNHLVSPGIQWGVEPGSFTHINELFGPILSVMRAENLEHAIQLANATSYGLTAGLHSLDEREHAIWLKKIVAGNCYINRGITGAIVERQPFGGTKKSSFGSGLKAGGPNYLLNMMHVEQTENIESYAYWYNQFFSKDCDPQSLLGQKNIQRYVPYEYVLLRLLPKDNLEDALRVELAAKICKTPLKISVHKDYPLFPYPWKRESDEEFIGHLKNERIRLLSFPEEAVVKKLSNRGLWQMPKPVVSNGRIELLNYLREVSISYDYHRYGNLGENG